MATWGEFESSAPEMAAAAAMLWPGITALGRGQPAPPGMPCFPVAFLATARPDSSPRLHPFCPVLAGGRLLAAIPRSSPKGDDLRRDPRCAIHALPGPEDDGLSIRARAQEAGNDPGLRAAALAVVTRSGVGGMIQTVSLAATGGKSACPRPGVPGQYPSSGSERPRFTPDLGRGQSRGVIPAR